MGDGKPFATLPAGKPVRVKINVDKGVASTHIDLFNGDRKVATFNGTEAVVKNPAPGIYSFIASATLADGSRLLSRPNTLVVEK